MTGAFFQDWQSALYVIQVDVLGVFCMSITANSPQLLTQCSVNVSVVIAHTACQCLNVPSCIDCQLSIGVSRSSSRIIEG